MKLCNRCRVSGCLLNYLGQACKDARKRRCPDVVLTRADKVREMDDEELAKFMTYMDGGTYCKEPEPLNCKKLAEEKLAACERCIYNWLQETVEEL